MEQEVNQTYLNEAILLLSQSYNNPTLKTIEKAQTLLNKSISSQSILPVAERADRLKNEKRNFIKSAASWWDNWIGGGVCLQEFVLFGMIPHGGKTHWLSWAGIQYLLQGEDVVYLIGEDLRCDIRENFERAEGITSRLQKHLWLADMGGAHFGVSESEQVVLNLRQKEGVNPRILILDHADAMADDLDWKEIGKVIKGIKSLAKRLNMVVFSASQKNFGRMAKGLSGLYGAKVAKSGEPDIIIMADDIVDDEYDMVREKIRGRSRRDCGNKEKTLICDWNSMEVTEA